MVDPNLRHKVDPRANLSPSMNVTPMFGPIIGGWLVQHYTWTGVFWFLAIFSGTVEIGMLLFFPETARILVGDGSLPAKGISRTIYAVLRDFCTRRKGHQQLEKANYEFQWHVPNPFNCVKVLAHMPTLFAELTGAVYYTVFGCVGASLSVQMVQRYQLNYFAASRRPNSQSYCNALTRFKV